MKRRRKRRGRSTTLKEHTLSWYSGFVWLAAETCQLLTSSSSHWPCQSLFHEFLFFLIFSPCPPWWLCFLRSSFFLLCQLFICHSFYPHSKSQLLSHTFAHCPSPSICFLRLSVFTLWLCLTPSCPLIHPSSYQPSLLSLFSLFCFLKIWKAPDTLSPQPIHTWPLCPLLCKTSSRLLTALKHSPSLLSQSLCPSFGLLPSPETKAPLILLSHSVLSCQSTLFSLMNIFKLYSLVLTWHFLSPCPHNPTFSFETIILNPQSLSVLKAIKTFSS